MRLAGPRLRADALLLVAALVWGLAFVPQRVAASHLGPFLFNGLRFLLAAAVLLPWVRAKKLGARRVLAWAAIAGGLLVLAAGLQQAGLRFTTAGNAGFLTGLYVVLVPLVLLVGWRHRVAWSSWTAALTAGVGVFLLSVDSQFRLGRGDALELLGAVVWAVHVVAVGMAVAQIDVLSFSVGQYLVAGIVNLALGLTLEWDTLPGLGACWWAVAYTGVFSVAVGYTLQAVGQRHAPPADAAIILSMEAVFAALFGYLFLGEVLTARQLAGCALILMAILTVQTGAGKRSRVHGPRVGLSLKSLAEEPSRRPPPATRR